MPGVSQVALVTSGGISASINAVMPARERLIMAKTLRGARRGINVAGAEFSASNVLWENPASFPFLYARGHRLIRLPFLWEPLQPTLAQPLNAAILAGLHATVSAAGAAGLKVILDVHNYARYNGVAYGASGSFTSAQFADLWTRLSTEFAADPAVIGYGLMNEPHDLPGGATAWQAVQQAAVTAIRGNDDPTCILIGGYSYAALGGWSSTSRSQVTPWITDPINNIRYEAHHYWDSNGGTYTTTYAQEQANASAAGWTGADPLQAKVLAELNGFIGWLKAFGARGYIGEYGFPSTATTDATSAASWAALAGQWLTRIDAEGDLLWATAWATGDRWSTGYSINFYDVNGSGVLATPRSNAATIEAHSEHGMAGQGRGVVETPPLPAFAFAAGTAVFPVGGAGGTTTSATLGVGTLRLCPFYLPVPMTIAGLAVEVATVGDTGSKIRLGLYADTGYGMPGQLIVDAGQVAGDVVSADAEAALATPLTLGPGWYWSAAVVQAVTTTQPTLRALGSNGLPSGFLLALAYGKSAPGANASALCYTQTGVTGALPTSINSSPTTGGSAARMMLRTG